VKTIIDDDVIVYDVYEIFTFSVVSAGMVSEQEEQRAAAETADVHGPRAVLWWCAENAWVPVEHEPRITRRPTTWFPVFRRLGRS